MKIFKQSLTIICLLLVSGLFGQEILTGLQFNEVVRNKALTEEHAERSLDNRNELHLPFFDDFKNVNDDFGHSAGDQVLLDVSSRIKSLLREEDTIARLGGDEFVVVLFDIQDESQVINVANKLIN